MLAKKAFSADLEHRKVFFMELGLCVALFVSIVAFEWNFKEPEAGISFASGKVAEDVTELIPIVEEPQKVPEVVQPSIVSDEFRIVPNNVSLNNNVDFFDSEPTADPVTVAPISVGTKAVEDVKEDDLPFIVVEDMPTFQNSGIEGFQKYVMKNMVYNEAARDAGTVGTVIVEFVIGKTGKIEDIKILRGVDPVLDNEVVRVLKNAPGWKPGYQRGNPVKVKFTLPVKFALQ